MTEHCKPQVSAAVDPHVETATDPLAQRHAAPGENVVIGGPGADALAASEPAELVIAGGGDDVVRLDAGGQAIDLGDGDDRLELAGELDHVDGGGGDDTVEVDASAGAFDIEVDGDTVMLSDRLSGETTTATAVETFAFADASFDSEAIRAEFGPEAEAPHIQVGEGTQTVTVNDPEPTVSVLWDRVVQQEVIDSDGGVGPTIASRAYALLHTAMFDAWASYDPEAVRVSFDAEGDNAALEDGLEVTDAHKAKAMSYAAATVLLELFPDQQALVATLMEDRLGFSLDEDRKSVV